MKCWVKFAALLLSLAAIQASSQSAPESKGGAQEAQMQSYWIDPSTRLMWAGKDNGKDVNWHKAVKYCRDLRLAGYSDWTLAKIGELEAIYDKNANAAGLVGSGRAGTWHIKGNLFLTGYQWSSTRSYDMSGHPGGMPGASTSTKGANTTAMNSGSTLSSALCVCATPENDVPADLARLGSWCVK